MHPSISKSLDIIKGSFERLCLKDQDILGDAERWNKVSKLDWTHSLFKIIFMQEWGKLQNGVLFQVSTFYRYLRWFQMMIYVSN